MKILVTGANGLLGQHLIKLLIDTGYAVIGLGRGPSRVSFPGVENFNYVSADLNDGQKISDLMELEKPFVVVHSGAMTQVDECENNQEACTLTNVQGTINILKAAENFSGHFIYVSTDFVFDGIKGNYSEDDQPGPVNYYGNTKLQAEKLVKQSSLNWTIVRTCLVYGNILQGNRSNIISWVKDNLEQNKKIKVVNDQWRTPTFVEDLATGILLIIQKRSKGVYHISGKEIYSPYQLAIKTAEFFNLDKSLIEEVDASSFSQPAKRPLKTGFKISKAMNDLGFIPHSLEDALRKIYR